MKWIKLEELSDTTHNRTIISKIYKDRIAGAATGLSKLMIIIGHP